MPSKSLSKLLTIFLSLIAFSYEATRKISKNNFEKAACPLKCKMSQDTRACVLFSSSAEILRENAEYNNSTLTVSNICAFYLQQNFNSITDCEWKCENCDPEQMVSKCTKSALNKKFGICKQPPDTGLCKAYFRMYYYDEKAKDCLTFIYGGCGGNDNKFKSHLECLLRCGLLGFAKEDSENFGQTSIHEEL